MSNNGKERGGSTKSLIASAEALRSEGSAKRKQGTRQMVREAEKLIGRDDQRRGLSGTGVALIVAIAIATVATALYFYYNFQ